jgi:AraC family transcriptional regulator
MDSQARTISAGQSEAEQFETIRDQEIAAQTTSLSPWFTPLEGFGIARLGVRALPHRSNPTLSLLKHVVLLRSTPAEVELEIEGRRSRSTVMPGNLTVVPIGHNADGRYHTPGEVLYLSIEPYCLGHISQEMGRDCSIKLLPVLESRDELLLQLANTLLDELQRGCEADKLYAGILAHAIVANLIRNFVSSGIREDRAYGPPSSALSKAVDYIHEHLGQRITLMDIALNARMSPSTLHVRFKKAMGKPLHKYVMEQRVRRVKELLATTKLPISEIADRVGFADQSHLTRVLYRHTGLTPKMHRDH